MSDPSTPLPPGGSARSGAARFRSGTGRGVRAIGRGVRRAGSATGRGASYTFRQARRASRAEGAGETGLYRLIEMHVFNTGGDAAVAVALAGTLFFAQPGEARGHVALFLGLTMLPFAVVAPLLGPFLDRFSYGRRWAIGVTMAARAILCLTMTGAASHNSIALYPAALGCLVSSKAYGVARAASIPRLLPERLTLVKANSRISLSGVIGGALVGGLAALASTLGGPGWALRVAFVAFAIATVLAVLLPPQADSVAGETPQRLRDALRYKVPGPVVRALRANAGLRMLSGFLTMFMAFLLRQHPLPGWEHHANILMALVIGAAGVGNTIGIGIGNVLRNAEPRVVVLVVLLADTAAAVVCAVLYGLTTAVALGLTAGICQGLGKLALDATIQHEVPERSRTSAFARSETLLQLSWVIGGFIGIAMPMVPRIGLGVLAGLMLGWACFVVVSGRGLSQVQN
ncbi:MFS transporter [Nocardioides terrisoli]|uniref:MFS transporter n=1 Tax=Nocardioides terrisoli TaxID=3388267 RepID=UPI00287BB31B|nr:MFS transporter [Nocardioides marmorisolisilvae]